MRDAAGALKKGWDTNANLAGTNLAGQGHPVDKRGPQHYASIYPALAARIFAPGGFRISGVHIDAQTEIPCWNEIDERKGSAFPHTIAECLQWRELAFQSGKDSLQGPLLGENSHWRVRAFETYAAGLLDGTSRKIPVHFRPQDGPPGAVCWDEAVIPDYELGEVIPRATAFFGMGWESHFMGSSFPVPDSFIDPWHCTLLSYGHAPYFGTNGDVPNNYWDWQRTARSYWLLHGISGAMRASRIVQVRYADAAGVELTLDQALAAGLDLKHPRLVLRFADGLELKANHAAANWRTTVLGQPYTLPMDGFAGARPDGLLALSAVNPASGARVDYAYEPGVAEVIDRRRVAQSYNGFPGALLPIPPGLFNPPLPNDTDLVIVTDLRLAQVVYAQGFATATQPLGTAPALVALRIEADDTAHRGRRPATKGCRGASRRQKRPPAML